MSRSYCPNCHYPERTCVCHAIDRTEYSIQLTIFQHPSEAGHAKNTARLISLVAEGVKIIVGESPEDFDEVREELLSNQGTVVLFPASTSISLSAAHKNSSVNKLLLIDGTWRKANKIWLSNPWLQQLRICHIDGALSHYRIRSGRVPTGLATIEAAASALKQLGQANTDALLKVFEAFQTNWPTT
ncbi:MAG: DTW domain-containing protein [Gammaproteobacteria bacterium]|mgnify:CR=1 FL=1|nr:DTW domain-containing protein [Gammaproteobacteria bacterium]|tara:strand:+ start:176 stop:733 length:558 start_codon:yes stop_codon:yes gene_type:complete